MTHGPNQPDNPIDIDVARALAALRSAAPPGGMEDRILQRLDTRLAKPQQTLALRSAWLRGALTGALTATAACAALFFALHAHRATVPQTTATVIAQPSSAATRVALHTEDPCPGAPSIRDGIGAPGEPALLAGISRGADGRDAKSSGLAPHSSRILCTPFMRDRQSAHGWGSTDSRPPHLIPASFAPSHPAPPAPLTAQERALAELARNANPALLAALSPAAQQKADAKRQADFDAFFAPSAEVRKIDEEQKQALGISDDEPAAPNSSKEGSL